MRNVIKTIETKSEGNKLIIMLAIEKRSWNENQKELNAHVDRMYAKVRLPDTNEPRNISNGKVSNLQNRWSFEMTPSALTLSFFCPREDSATSYTR